MTTPFVTAVELRDVLFRDDTDRPGDQSPVPFADGEIDWALASAQAEVEGKIASRYVIPDPLDPVPQILKDITTDIAVYLLWLRYRAELLEQTDPVWLRWQRSEELLTQIVDGLLILPIGDDDSGAQMNQRSRVKSTYTGNLFHLQDFNLGYGGYRRRC